MLNKHGSLDWNLTKLYNGCILAGIAHAMMIAHYPIVANEHSWDGCNYSVQDSAGSRGTVTFSEKYCVGAFRNENTKRATPQGYKIAAEYLWNTPIDILKAAQDGALQYLLDFMDDGAVPVITTAFWGDDKGFHINDTYDDFIEYGGFLLLRQNMDFERAINAWIDEYEMTSGQVDLLKSIYERKIAKPDEKITLTKEEIYIIDSDDPEGIKESKISFEELNIYWED